MTIDQSIVTGLILFFIIINFIWSCGNIAHGNRIKKLADETVEMARKGLWTRTSLEVLDQALNLAEKRELVPAEDKAPDEDGEEPYYKVWAVFEPYDPVKGQGEEQDVDFPSVACFADEDQAVAMVGELTEFGQLPKVWRQLVLRTVKGMMQKCAEQDSAPHES